MKFIVGLFLALSLFVVVPRRIAHAATSSPQVAEQDDSGENGSVSSDDSTAFVPATTTTPPASTTTNTSRTPTTTVKAAPANTAATTSPSAAANQVTTSSQPAVATSPPTASAVIPVGVSTAFPWAWITSRGTGIASFVLLGLLSATGILLTTGAFFRLLSPAAAWSLHRAIGTALLFSVLVHVFSLLLDSFIKLRVVDLLIPFVSPYKSLYLAFGIIGFYILLLVLVTSLYTISSHAKFWRSVHFFAFPMYLLVFLHSYLVGTDTKEWWMQIIYWGSAAIIGAAVIYRLAWKYGGSAARTQPPPRIS